MGLGFSGANRLRQEARSREKANRANSFWDAFLMTENGKVKSTLLIYSLFISFLFLAVYFAAFIFLLEPLHGMTENAPIIVVYLVESLVPAIAGTAVCGLTWLLFPDKRLVPAAYVWLAVMALTVLITMMIMLEGESEARTLFLRFFAMAVPAPLILGGIMSFCLYRRYLKMTPKAEKFLERGVGE